jgi:hypothetical protein
MGVPYTPESRSWQAMKNRCLNPRGGDYKDYGGRGISVCDRWLSFESFYEDMGPRPIGTSIERIDNSGNYEPGNCKWATPAEQHANKRGVKLSASKAADIRRRYSNGSRISALAAEYGVSTACVLKVVRNQAWKTQLEA